MLHYQAKNCSITITAGDYSAHNCSSPHQTDDSHILFWDCVWLERRQMQQHLNREIVYGKSCCCWIIYSFLDLYLMLWAPKTTTQGKLWQCLNKLQGGHKLKLLDREERPISVDVTHPPPGAIIWVAKIQLLLLHVEYLCVCRAEFDTARY